ncbi:MAG TPA: hypothetical protein VF802_07735, partial [Candidatus Limnocylindrales bacterium]
MSIVLLFAVPDASGSTASCSLDGAMSRSGRLSDGRALRGSRGWVCSDLRAADDLYPGIIARGARRVKR